VPVSCPDIGASRTDRRGAVPEGDTLHRAAARVGAAIAGEVIVAVGGSHPAMREGRRLVRARITKVSAIGKHLVISASSGWSVRTHLGMTGSWHTYGPGARWRTSPGKARVVLRTDAAVAVCFAAPHVELAPTDVVMERLERIGPDLALRSPPIEAMVHRARRSPSPTVADLLLDQQVASGIGNVYKSEVMFLERTAPSLDPSALDDDQLRSLYVRGNRLLLANLTDARRTTTGNGGRQRTWVYGRGGRPCRRCSSTISTESHGSLDRVTFWCPSCQRIEV
jgi:endonuclease-8